jgi:NAD-dependent dihydropyrimidine dehydrogenase PreA subunit/flavodoxin
MEKEACSVSTEIYYFSGTGNSLHVAQELQKRIPEAGLFPILSLVNQETVTTSGETVGLVFPHYASSLPKVVHEFVQKLDLTAAKYLFAIVTRGRTETMAFREMDAILREKGRRLDSFFVFTMPSGSAPLIKGYAENVSKERVDRLESEMLARLDSIQRIIVSQETSRETDTGDGLQTPPLLVPFLPLLRAVSPFLVRLGKRVESSFGFYYDEKCTGCGVCEKVCLAGKVQLVDERPVWREATKCHGCFACLNYCPLESIQVESSWYLKSYTAQNGRYHHPEIKAQAIAGQKAMRAAYHQPVPDKLGLRVDASPCGCRGDVVIYVASARVISSPWQGRNHLNQCTTAH